MTRHADNKRWHTSGVQAFGCRGRAPTLLRAELQAATGHLKRQHAAPPQRSAIYEPPSTSAHCIATCAVPNTMKPHKRGVGVKPHPYASAWAFRRRHGRLHLARDRRDPRRKTGNGGGAPATRTRRAHRSRARVGQTVGPHPLARTGNHASCTRLAPARRCTETWHREAGLWKNRRQRPRARHHCASLHAKGQRSPATARGRPESATSQQQSHRRD